MRLDAAPNPALADIDPGQWAGQTLEAVHATDPAGVLAWTTDPAAAPHGGESVEDALRRTEGFLHTLDGREGRIVAVTHAAILRAALILALKAPAAAFWRVDVPPLCCLRLRGGAGRWTLLALSP